MCTVTFIPLYSSGYLLTSNRDEKTSRPAATPPYIEEGPGYQLAYPKDPQGGGSWIASDNRNNSVCLLNGASRRHVPTYPYRHSRGLVVIDFFRFGNLFDFIDLYDLNNIEPFTLVIIHDFRLFEFRWDGDQRKLQHLNFSEPRIWSSVSLYDDATIKKRDSWFYAWLKGKPPLEVKQVLNFHMFAGEGNQKTDILMKKNDHLRTISITSIRNENNLSAMFYKDILNGQEKMVTIGENVEHRQRNP